MLDNAARLLQHNDTAGLQEMAAYALNGQPLQTRRQALHETGGNGVRSEYNYELQTRRLSWLRSSICQSRLTQPDAGAQLHFTTRGP